MKNYGKELILDIHNCDVKLFNRKILKKYLIELCELIDMKREDLHFWDYKDEPEEYEEAPVHLKGVSLIQFITTSNITIHTLDILKRVYINIFSCKDFDSKKVINFTSFFFCGKVKSKKVVKRI